MRVLAALATALVVSCASSTAVVDHQFLHCESGQDISIQAGLNSSFLTEDGAEDRFNVMVEISNNSHEDVEVKMIRVEQLRHDTSRYTFDNGYGRYDRVIPPGKDYTFELPTTGRALRATRTIRESGQPLDLAVFVTLANGDQYRCQFAVDPSR